MWDRKMFPRVLIVTLRKAVTAALIARWRKTLAAVPTSPTR